MIKTIVSRICTALYSATNSQRNSEVFDSQLVTEALNLSNMLGVTDYVKNWYETTDQYNRSLTQTLNDCFPQDQDVQNLLTAGDNYWSSYGLAYSSDDPTSKDIQNHGVCYILAKNANDAILNTHDDQKVKAVLYEAGARCLLDQTTAAFDTFFKTSTGLSSHPLHGQVESLHDCGEQSVTTYTPVANKSAGDEGTGGGDAVDTISDGSALKIWDRSTHVRTNEPMYMHHTNTSTLHTLMMMSDLSESVIDDQTHTRLSNTFDKIQISSEYIDNMVTFFSTTSALSFDTKIDDTMNTKLQNKFLQNQIGDRALIADEGQVATTRYQTISS